MDAPDFELIADHIAEETGIGRLEEWGNDDPARVKVAIVEALRQVWNARAAADIAKVQLLDEAPAEMVSSAIKALDR